MRPTLPKRLLVVLKRRGEHVVFEYDTYVSMEGTYW